MNGGLEFKQVYNIEDCKRNWLFHTMHFWHQSILNDERVQNIPIELVMHDWWTCRETNELTGLSGSPAHPFWCISFWDRYGCNGGPELYWVWEWQENGGDMWPTGPDWAYSKMPTLDLCKEANTKLIYYGDYEWGGIDPAIGTRIWLVKEEQNLLESVLDFVIPHLIATSKEQFDVEANLG